MKKSNLSVAFSIALRYLFSPKQFGAVNIISLISVAGIAVAAAAIVVVMSVFNGFSGLASQQLSRLDPPLAVTPATGKVITTADSLSREITAACPGIKAVPVIIEQALARHLDRQMPVRLMGVPSDFPELSNLDDVTIDGECAIERSPWPLAMSSVGVALGLGARPGDIRFIDLYAPRRKGRINTANPSSAFRTDSVIVAGVYQTEHESYDTDMLIVPIEATRRLLDYPVQASSLYIYPPAGADTDRLQKDISRIIGDGYKVKNRMQQQAASFKMIEVEKWITFLLLTFILIIASFNIISTMAMLKIEKEPNTAILLAMGATPRLASLIFMLQSWMVTVAGGIAGIITGVMLCLLQQYGGIIKLHTSNPSALTIDVYPVVLDPADLLTTTLIIVAIGAVTALFARR